MGCEVWTHKLALNCCSGCGPWEKGRAGSSESSTRGVPPCSGRGGAGQTLLSWSGRESHTCIVGWEVVGSSGSSTFCPRLTLPLSFLPPFARLHCHLDLCVLSRHLFCPSQPSAFPWQTHKTLGKPSRGRKGESLGSAGGLSRQCTRSPLLTPLCF